MIVSCGPVWVKEWNNPQGSPASSLEIHHGMGSLSFMSRAKVVTQEPTKLRKSLLLIAFYLAIRERRFPLGIFNQQNLPCT